MPAPTPPPAPTPVDFGQSLLNSAGALANPELFQTLFGATAGQLPQWADLYNQAATQQAFGSGAQFDPAGFMAGTTPETAQQLQAEFARVQGLGDTRDFNTWLSDWAQAGAESGDPNAMRILRGNQQYDPNSAVGRAIDASTAISQAENDAASAARRSTMEDVISLGPQLQDMFRASNPELQAALGNASSLGGRSDYYGGLENAINGTQQFGDVGWDRVQAGQVGEGALGASLYDQAMNANGLGAVGQQLQDRAGQFANSTGELSADELRQLDQSIKEGYAQRGTLDSGQAISAEALGRLTNTRERMLQDLGIASSLNQVSQAELGANRAFAQGVQGADVGRQFGNVANTLQSDIANQQTGLSAGMANRDFAFGQQQQGIQNQALLGQLLQGQNAQDRNYALGLVGAQQGSSIDPWQALTGISSMAPQAGMGIGANAYQNASGISGSNLFDTSAGVNLDLANAANLANYNANIYASDAAMYGANKQASATKKAGLFSALGNLFCWVAREVYGADNPKWIEFRHWMLNYAPKWFVKLYCKYGERFAAFISDKPVLKYVIRKWMDSKIKTLYKECPLSVQV